MKTISQRDVYMVIVAKISVSSSQQTKNT